MLLQHPKIRDTMTTEEKEAEKNDPLHQKNIISSKANALPSNLPNANADYL